MAAAAAPAIEVTRLLLHAQDPDPNVRGQAEAQISAFQEQNYAGFLGLVAGVVLAVMLSMRSSSSSAGGITAWMHNLLSCSAQYPPPPDQRSDVAVVLGYALYK